MQRGDKRLAVAALALIAVAAVFTLRNYEAAFPQASLHLVLSKAEITQKAAQFLAGRGLTTEGFRELTLFDADNDARLFLEKELGLKEANRLMDGDVSVWRWRARWFKPPEKEELLVYLSPGGKLVGFHHIIPENAAGARLEKKAALALAQRFLDQQTSDPHRLIEEQLQERPNRYDYVFTWEREGFRAKDATYRRTVVVQGDEIGEYSEYLHVPERWDREYAAMRSSNQLYSGIAQALFVLLGVIALIVLVRALVRRQIRWKPLITICVAASALAVLNEWNMLPFYIDSMPTSTPYFQMVALGLLQGLGAGVGYFFYIILGAAPGEPLYRAANPQRLSLEGGFSRHGIFTREFFRAAVAGYGFTAVHLVYLVAFYLIGKRIGVWSPQDVGYSDLLSTGAPWLYPMTIGVLASTSEEFWFRLFAVPLLKRYLKSTWLAVLIPAFIWGFLHANYPQQPGFIRGLEVGIVGIGAGWLLLRFGIFATLIWHYTIDALLVSTILFESESWYYWAAGIIVSGAVLIPLGISLARYRRNGGFIAEPALTNALVVTAPRVEEETHKEAPAPPAARPAWPAKWLYLAAGVAAVIGVVASPVKYGDFITVRVSRTEAVETAREALTGRGVKTDEWRHAARFITNLDEADFEYVRRLEGSDAANRTVKERTFHGVWLVRYVQPMHPEEWRVFVNQRGVAYRVDHVLEETAPGANLSPEEARREAQQFLAGERGVPLDHYRLVDSHEEVREKRTDHDFVWEDEQFRVGEARARISLSVIGDEVSSYRRFLKLPEQWLREFHRPRVQGYIVEALAGGVGLLLLIVFVQRIGARQQERRHRRHWKVYLTGGAGAALIMALGALNGWGNVVASYNTAEPLDNFLMQWLLGRLMFVVLIGLGFFFLLMAADVFLRMAARSRALPRPSLPRAVAAGVLIWGLVRGMTALEFAIPGDRYALPLWSIADPATSLPALAALGHGVLTAVAFLAALTIIVSAAYRYLMNRNGLAALALILAAVAFSRGTNLEQWVFYFAYAVVLSALIVFLLRTCGLDLISFATVLFCLEAAPAGLRLAGQPAADLHWNGIAVLGVALLCTAAVFFFNRKRPQVD